MGMGTMDKTTRLLGYIQDAEAMTQRELRAAPTRHLSLIATQLEYARLLEEDRIKNGLAADAS
jgi:hypothetical protein